MQVKERKFDTEKQLKPFSVVPHSNINLNIFKKGETNHEKEMDYHWHRYCCGRCPRYDCSSCNFCQKTRKSVPMKLTQYEKETILLYNEAEQTASVYTHDRRLILKLKRLSEKYPDQIYPDKPESGGAVSYIVPKRCISVREPYSDARRKADSERAKASGIAPPGRSVSSKTK